MKIHTIEQSKTPDPKSQDYATTGQMPANAPSKGFTANAYFVDVVNRIAAETTRRMGEESPEIPTDYPCIDIGCWMAEHTSTTESKAERDRVVEAVAKQAIECGSFNICGHGIDMDLLDRLEAQSNEFFDMKQEEKEKFFLEGSPRGYTPIQGESVSAIVYDRKADNKETECKDLREIFRTVFPPDGNKGNSPDSFQKVLDEYNYHMNKLDLVLHEVLAAALAWAKGVSLPKDIFNDAKGSSTQGLLVCSRYPKMSKEYDQFSRLGAHSDWGPLTILYSECTGLEEVRQGRWIQVPFRKGELHVAIGEPMAAWSNMLFKNNIHRVSQNATPNRISYAYFPAQGYDLNRDDTDKDGIEPICAPGEAPLFGKISPSSHVHHYLKTAALLKN